MTANLILWALPKGANDRLHEQPMTSMLLTSEQVERVKAAASKEGWHSFRVQVDDFSIPNFAKAVRA